MPATLTAVMLTAAIPTADANGASPASVYTHIPIPTVTTAHTN